MVLRTAYADARVLLGGPLQDPSYNFATDRFRNTGSPTPPTTTNLPIPIKVVGIIIERSLTESLGLATDATVTLIRRVVSVSEPSISVVDAISLLLRRVRGVSEPAVSVSDEVQAVKFVPLTERNISEPDISVADAVELILRRVREISEPTISIVDAVDTISVRVIDVSEPDISLTDVVSYILQRAIEVSEPTISIVDVVSLMRQTGVEILEPTVSVSDEVATEKIIIRERSALEIFGVVGDAVSPFIILGWSEGAFGTKSQVTVIGAQVLTTVIATQAVTEVKGYSK